MVATGAITLYMFFIPRMLGIEEMDIGITIGAISDPDGGAGAFLGRMAWHVGNGLIYVFIYAAVLLFLQKQSTAWRGLVFGGCLWLVGPMTLVPVLLNLHPQVYSGEWTNPGIFMLSLGAGWKPAAIDLVAHLTHGLLTGAIYKHSEAVAASL